MTRILADENCDKELVAALRAAGHDVIHATELECGREDAAWLDIAIADNRILLTSDLDFGLLAERSGEHSVAIVLLRLHQLTRSARIPIVLGFFKSVSEDWRGKFFVVEPGAVRERTINRDSKPSGDE